MIALRINRSAASAALRPGSMAKGLVPRAAGARSKVRIRRTRGAAFGWIVLAIGLLSIFGIAYVAETAAATQASYQIGTLKARQAQLQAQQQQIRYQISVATSAGKIDGDASGLGMVRSSQWQYLPGSSSPVALARPTPTDGANSNRSWLEQLALALGRPTEAQAKGP
jgi:outer membrane murein-binding lipoprotein Lpp